MVTDKNGAETQEASDGRAGLIERVGKIPARLLAAARMNKLLTVAVLCGSAIIVGSGTSAIYYWFSHRTSPAERVSVQAALALLDAGEYEKAKQMAQQLADGLVTTYPELGDSLFIQGAILAHEAEQQEHADRQTLYLVAARYLQESRERGFPPGREKQGLYLLATSLFNAEHFAESLPVLHDCLAQLPKEKYRIAQLLSTAYLRDNVPNLKQASHYNRIWLEDPALTPTQRDDALLQLAEISLLAGNTSACNKALAEISDDSAVRDRALLLRARSLIHEGGTIVAQSSESNTIPDEAQQRYREAIKVLQRAIAEDTSDEATRQSQYFLGIANQKLGDLRAATMAFERTWRMHYGSPEALAAALAEGELALRQRRYDIAETLLLKALEDAGNASTYRNRWVPWNELRGRLTAALKQCISDRQFKPALAIAEAFSDTFSADEAALAQAQTHEAWGAFLLKKADSEDLPKADITRAEARRRFRLAATAYETLAELRFATPEYPHDLWQSGYCFLRGQNYDAAIRMLRKHLDNVRRKNSPPALVALGEAHLALGHYHTAIGILSDCITTFPKHPATYEARLLASHAYRQAGDLAKAQELLSDNLHNSALSPRSRFWQESLFHHGKLFFEEAMIHETTSRKELAQAPLRDPLHPGFKRLQKAYALFQEAIIALEEMVARDPEGRLSFPARYYVAEAYRHAAILPRRSLEIEPTQTRRNVLRQEMRSHLKEAARVHREIQILLTQRQEKTNLSSVERSILRNSYFAYADTLFALEQYEDAITAYVTATNHYQHEPEALGALLQIASCYRRLDMTAEAHGTLLQAQAVLARIPADADFQKTTPYDRGQWEQLLGWLAQL